ncbi:MAG: alpha/beta fold hydrolase [Clostridia bacterium]|nr:alpha/beta fold hydrolase [Clostridia bacterium]
MYTGKVLESYVDLVCQKTGATRVNIVAHSMGGLVTSAYLMQASNVKVSSVVTLGSPFLGSDMATELLYEKDFTHIVKNNVLPILGYGKQARSDASSMKETLINAATNAMYDIAVTTPSIYSLIQQNSQSLFADNETVAATGGFNTSKKLLEAYKSAFSKVEHYNIIGVSADVIKFDLTGDGYTKAYVDGDGTVSKDSACAGGLFESNLTELNLSHVNLVKDIESINIVKGLLYYIYVDTCMKI